MNAPFELCRIIRPIKFKHICISIKRTITIFQGIVEIDVGIRRLLYPNIFGSVSSGV